MTKFERLATAVKYGWRNSPHPTIIQLHALVESMAGGKQAVKSTVSSCPDAPSISYAGVPQGLANILKLTDVLRSRDFPGPVKWSDSDDGVAADISLLGTVGRGDPCDKTELVMPFRIHLVIPTPDVETVKRGISRREQPRFKSALKQEQWRARIVTDEAQVRDFYTRMHLPTMANRHSDAMRTETLEFALHIARQGGLFLSESSSGPVAGCLFTQRNGVFTTRLLGVEDGADDHYESGAFKGLYYLMLQHCATATAIHEMDLFGTEAFISKGIFQWKRKLGAEVRPAPNHFQGKYLKLRVNRDSPGVRKFLVRNPVLIDTPSGLKAAYFSDGENVAVNEFSARIGGPNEQVYIPLDEFMAYSVSDSPG